MELKELKKDVLTTQEVCEILQVTRVGLWKWEKQGKLIPTRLGKLIRYKKIDIEKILKDGIK